MFDFHEKRKIRNWIYSKFTIAVLMVLIGFLSVSVYERFSAMRMIAEKRAEKERELQDLEVQASTLRAKLEYLEEGRGVEEELRSRFDVAKEGEQAVIIVENIDDASATKAQNTPPGKWENEDGTPWWKSFKFW